MTEVMLHAHDLWRRYKAGRIEATRGDFAFFLKCAWALKRMETYGVR